MLTANKSEVENLELVCRLFHEYKQDPNCRPRLWISGCVREGDCTQAEADIFISMVRDDEQLSKGLDYMERYHP